MKAKKLFVMSLAVICAFAILLSFFFIFSIKDVNATYTVTEGCSVDEIEKTLDSYQKKNLLFLDVEDVKSDLAKYPYFEVVSIEKDFPNVLNVVLKERIEVFTIMYNANVYVLDKTGFVVNSLSEQSFNELYQDRQLIDITFKGLAIETIKVGEVVKTDDQALFEATLNMSATAQYSDIISSVEISKMVEGENGEQIISRELNFVSFQTNTGVVIRIVKGQDRGIQKISNALDRYYLGSDYDKARGVIESSFKDSGESYVVWEGI